MDDDTLRWIASGDAPLIICGTHGEDAAREALRLRAERDAALSRATAAEAREGELLAAVRAHIAARDAFATGWPYSDGDDPGYQDAYMADLDTLCTLRTLAREIR